MSLFKNINSVGGLVLFSIIHVVPFLRMTALLVVVSCPAIISSPSVLRLLDDRRNS